MSKRSPRRFLRDLFSSQSSDLERILRTRVANAEDARDLAQEAFMRLLRLERTEFIRRPEQYLLRIAAKLAYEHRLKARNSRVDTMPEVPEALHERMPSAEDEVLTEHSVLELERTLEQLPPNVQAALIWHRRDGLTYAEIGERLGVSGNMVKKYLQKGVAHCRAELKENGNDD